MNKRHTTRGNGQSPPPVAAPAAQSSTNRRETTKHPDFFSIYANDIQVAVSNWDIRLILGEIGDLSDTDPNVLNIKQLGEIRLSLQIAKRLADILTAQIKAYEKQ